MNVFVARLSSEGIIAPGLVELLAGAKVNLSFTSDKLIIDKLYSVKLSWTVKFLEFVIRDKTEMKYNNNKIRVSSFVPNDITQLVLKKVPYCRIYTLV